MDKSNRNQTKQMENDASDMIQDGKKWAKEMCDEGLNKMHHAEDSIKEYSDQLIKTVQENPIAAVLIAGGIGFLLSKIMSK